MTTRAQVIFEKKSSRYTYLWGVLWPEEDLPLAERWRLMWFSSMTRCSCETSLSYRCNSFACRALGRVRERYCERVFDGIIIFLMAEEFHLPPLPHLCRVLGVAMRDLLHLFFQMHCLQLRLTSSCFPGPQPSSTVLSTKKKRGG